MSPLLLGLLGLWVDNRAGTTPLFTILFAIAGIVGAAVKLYYGYRYAMTEIAAARAVIKGEPVSPGKLQ